MDEFFYEQDAQQISFLYWALKKELLHYDITSFEFVEDTNFKLNIVFNDKVEYNLFKLIEHKIEAMKAIHEYMEFWGIEMKHK